MKMMCSVCVHLSVMCLNLIREQKGLESPKLTGWKPITYVLGLIRRINAVTDNARYTGRGNYN